MSTTKKNKKENMTDVIGCWIIRRDQVNRCWNCMHTRGSRACREYRENVRAVPIRKMGEFGDIEEKCRK